MLGEFDTALAPVMAQNPPHMAEEEVDTNMARQTPGGTAQPAAHAGRHEVCWLEGGLCGGGCQLVVCLRPIPSSKGVLAPLRRTPSVMTFTGSIPVLGLACRYLQGLAARSDDPRRAPNSAACISDRSLPRRHTEEVARRR